MKRVRVGILGCGNIAGAYMRNINSMFSGMIEVTACASRSPEKAGNFAREFGIPRACSPGELLDAEDVEVVLNLTPPGAHGETCRNILAAGKHVYVEKPFGISREDCEETVNAARRAGLVLCSAPDTFLGSAAQTMRRLMDAGTIGVPVGGSAFKMIHGHENWHPNPASFYKQGGGPVFDMAPYFITLLVNCLGPIVSAAAFKETAFTERMISADGPRKGERIPVETPTHFSSVARFANNAVVNLGFSFDTWAASLPYLEIYGTKGSLSLKHPFAGPLLLSAEGGNWEEVPVPGPFSADSRGLGIAEMARAIRTGSSPRTEIKLAWHVMDTLFSIIESAGNGRIMDVRSGCPRPEIFLPEHEGQFLGQIQQ